MHRDLRAEALQRRDQIFCSTGGIDGHQKSFLPTPAGTARIQHAYLNPADEQKRRRLQHGKSAEPGMAHHKPPFHNQAALRGQGCAVLKQRKAVILLQKFTHAVPNPIAQGERWRLATVAHRRRPVAARMSARPKAALAQVCRTGSPPRAERVRQQKEAERKIRGAQSRQQGIPHAHVGYWLEGIFPCIGC